MANKSDLGRRAARGTLSLVFAILAAFFTLTAALAVRDGASGGVIALEALVAAVFWGAFWMAGRQQ